MLDKRTDGAVVGGDGMDTLGSTDIPTMDEGTERLPF